MLVGYPVDGIAVSAQGRMHATPAADVLFTQGFGRTYLTGDIRSAGGNSGGPLCVRFEGGAYYPAAVYLGGTAQTVVRAIDGPMIELFNRAEESGNGGQNNTGGGITHTSVTNIGSSSSPGAIRVNIEPAGARSAGAGWRLSPEAAYRTSGAQKSGLNAGNYVLQLRTVGGYQAPTQQTVQGQSGKLVTVTYSYAAQLTAQEAWRLANFGSAANSGIGADTEDPDKDGFTNQEEYAAGTNPRAAGDYLKVLNPTVSGTTFTVTVAGKAGRTYTLQRTTNLATGTWGTVATRGPQASDIDVQLADPAIPAGAAYYRVTASVP